MKTMFKNRLYYIASLLLMFMITSCGSLFDETQQGVYDGTTKKLAVAIAFPEGFQDKDKEGVKVTITDVDKGNKYNSKTNNKGVAEFEVGYGIYRMAASDKLIAPDGSVMNFNGTLDGIRVTATSTTDLKFNIGLISSKSGQIIIKELYSAGCKKTPQEGEIQTDTYAILYNNTDATAYLDGICFGSPEPQASGAVNVWITKDPITGEVKFRDYIPITECLWQFPGNGQDFPLAPGEQAVIAIRDAVNHNASFPESINLDMPDYFVCYDNQLFKNTLTPGNNIQQSRHLIGVSKLGLGGSTSYTIGTISPNIAIFNIPKSEGTAKEYSGKQANLINKPGASNNICLKIPVEWVLDAIEVFSLKGTNTKRLAPTLDSGFGTIEDKALRHTVYRNVDIDATMAIVGNESKIVYGYKDDPNDINAEATIRNGGRIIYMDTNNSTNDFHERKIQSLHPDSSK